MLNSTTRFLHNCERQFQFSLHIRGSSVIFLFTSLAFTSLSFVFLQRIAFTIMSFTITIRQGPARIASRLPQFSQTAKSVFQQPSKTSPITAIRALHQAAPKKIFPASRPALLASRKTVHGKFASSLVSRLTGSSRTYYQQTAAPEAADQGSLLRKLLVGGAIFGGTLVAVNIVFNRETREDGGMPMYERKYLNSTFFHTGLGVGIIGLTAYQMVQSGFVYRIMVTNPWVVAIGGMALSFGSMLATRAIDPDKYVCPCLQSGVETRGKGMIY